MDERPDVNALILAALEEMGPQVVADARALTSVDYPPASAAGTPPRRRTGQLSEGFGFTVEVGPDGPELNLTNSAPHFAYTEDGTSKMAARPVIPVLMQKWGLVISARVVAVVAGASVAPALSSAGGGFLRRALSSVLGKLRGIFGRRQL